MRTGIEVASKFEIFIFIGLMRTGIEVASNFEIFIFYFELLTIKF